jgi:hypothetical protein
VLSVIGVLPQEVKGLLVDRGNGARAASDTARTGSGARSQLVLFETEGAVLADVESSLRARYGYHVRSAVVGETGTLCLPAPAAPRVARDGRESLELPDGFDRSNATGATGELGSCHAD